MSRLFLLNVLLLAGIAMAALKLMELRDETARREAMVHAGAPKLPQAKGTAAIAPPERTVAANYLDIASRLLFSKDRNPTVFIAPPPVKQIPAFPLAYGVLMMADPPIIMMAPKKGEGQKGYRAGDQIADSKSSISIPASSSSNGKGRNLPRTCRTWPIGTRSPPRY